MTLDDALKTLALSSYRGLDDLKRAFHTQAHRYHPDKNPDANAATRFRELLEAYQFCLQNIDVVARRFDLSEEAKRRDRERVRVENLGDIFADIFGFTNLGRVFGYREPVILTVTLEEFIFGGVKRAKLPAYEPCPACLGAGAAMGTLARICRHCFGKGCYERRTSGVASVKICPRCQGRGREMESPCQNCQGFGRMAKTRKQDVILPVGLKPERILTLSARDAASGRDTEVVVILRVAPHAIFQIENDDLLCEYHCDFSSHRGDRIFSLKTPFGDKPLLVSRAACPGDVVTIKGAGLFKDSARAAQGDLRVRLRRKRVSVWNKLRQALFGRRVED